MARLALVDTDSHILLFNRLRGCPIHCSCGIRGFQMSLFDFLRTTPNVAGRTTALRAVQCALELQKSVGVYKAGRLSLCHSEWLTCDCLADEVTLSLHIAVGTGKSELQPRLL